MLGIICTSQLLFILYTEQKAEDSIFLKKIFKKEALITFFYQARQNINLKHFVMYAVLEKHLDF